ncbi:MAG: molecular chaperone TorD family protein, partial [Ramlibacter sp.]
MAEFDPDKATARQDLCRLLAACYYEPDTDLVEMGVFEDMIAAARRLDPTLAESARKLAEAFAGHDLKSLSADYQRLFGGPGQPLVPPQGSHWVGSEPSDAQESTAALLALYQEGGFEIEEEMTQAPDHVALQLEFLYRLTAKQNEARQADWDEEVLKAWQHLQRMFLGSHLGAWVGRFAAAVKGGAQTPFYRELA